MCGLPSASRPWEENGFSLCVDHQDCGWLGLWLVLAVVMTHFACQKSSVRGAEQASRAKRIRGFADARVGFA